MRPFNARCWPLIHPRVFLRFFLHDSPTTHSNFFLLFFFVLSTVLFHTFYLCQMEISCTFWIEAMKISPSTHHVLYKEIGRCSVHLSGQIYEIVMKYHCHDILKYYSLVYIYIITLLQCKSGVRNGSRSKTHGF